MKRENYVLIVLLAAAALIMTLGCAATYAPKGQVACPAEIAWNVAPQAEVTSFSCTMGEYGKEPATILKVGVKNVSDKDRRFRVQVFLLDEGKAVGGLVPVKGKPPVLKPGQDAVVTYPVPKTNQLPKKLEVVINAMSIGQ
jgi:hypothetical protein